MFNVVEGEKEHLCWYLSTSTTQASDVQKKTVKLNSHKDDFNVFINMHLWIGDMLDLLWSFSNHQLTYSYHLG